MAGSSRDPYPEDETIRVPDDEVLRGPANWQVVIVPKGYKRTPTARPTPREFLAYCNNDQRELDEYALPVAYHEGLWYRIVPQTTGFYQKEPKNISIDFQHLQLTGSLTESQRTVTNRRRVPTSWRNQRRSVKSLRRFRRWRTEQRWYLNQELPYCNRTALIHITTTHNYG